METGEFTRVKGTIIEKVDTFKFLFSVEKYDHNVLVKLSGKQAMYSIKLAIGMEFILEISPYDKTRGRIPKKQFYV